MQRHEDATRAPICATSSSYLQRLLTESEQGRAQTTAELRNDLRMLTRTVAALGRGQSAVTTGGALGSGDGRPRRRRAATG